MKTNNHNKQLYRDMQEAPDKYSDQEIEAMMDDLDQVPDVDEAWQQFESEELKFHSLLRKMAASFVGLLLVSGVAFAAIHIVRQYQETEVPQAADTMAEANSSLHSSLLILHSQPIPSSSLDLSFSTMSHSIASLRTLLPIITLIWIFRIIRPVNSVSISYGIRKRVCKRS